MAQRVTNQRRAIEHVFETCARPLSTQEILEQAAAAVPGIGIATVYRAVRELQDERRIAAVPIAGEAPRYERARHAHHHHFYCQKCTKVFSIDECPGDLSRLLPPGFRLMDHEITLRGECAECAAAT